MKRFAELFRELDETTRTSVRSQALQSYFRDVPAADAAWAVSFLCGRRPRRVVTLTQLRTWCTELAELPEWLFQECYEFTGDLAETIALLLPAPADSSTRPLHEWVEQWLLPLQNQPPAQQRQTVATAWSQLDQRQRLVFNKLLTGGFRVGVSQKLVVRALADHSGVDPAVITHRLMGHWQPTAAFFCQLLDPDTQDTDISRPYPCCLAQPLTGPLISTMETADRADQSSSDRLTADPPGNTAIDPLLLPGPVTDWLIEWKWDGIRAQLIRRQGQLFIWSRGGELLTDRLPELHVDAGLLPDGTVLDGEIIAWQNGRAAGFSELQRRVNRPASRPTTSRRTTRARRQATELPVRFVAFDLLEDQGQDIRSLPLLERRQRLEHLLETLPALRQPRRPRRAYSLFPEALPDDQQPHPQQSVAEADAGLTEPLLPGDAHQQPLVASPLVRPATWQECTELWHTSRSRGVEGLMLKRADSACLTGRATGLWWKWKTQPCSCDAVLVYAQRGHGRRAGLYTDYTFAAWQDGQLVPFAKAYSGLTDAEIREVDRFIQDHTLERFGPVRKVEPLLVFELAFEGLQTSSRHKSGIALRFPRIVRWRTDKQAAQADTIDSIRQLARATR